MGNKKPLILISNDDGYNAKGVRSLIETLRDLADLLVCSPESPRSGFSAAFSATSELHLKLREESEGVEIWSCDGTPVDCVKMALSELCGCRGRCLADNNPKGEWMSKLSGGRKPDMVAGGINHGDNSTVNSHYSGTMGLVMEGCMKFIPSVAFSLCDHDPNANFTPLRPLIREISRRILAEGLPKGVCLNVNFPLIEGPYKGVKICRMAVGSWGREVVRCVHPRGYEYYWLVGEYTNEEPEAEDTDNWALTHGYVAITPTTMDLTAYEMVEKMKDWGL